MAVFVVSLFRANKRWFTKESNMDRFYYTIDLWLRIGGVGITKDSLNFYFTNLILFVISTVPFFLTDVMGIVYHYYYINEVLGETNDILGVQSTLIFTGCIVCFSKPFWFLYERREICRVVTFSQELGPVAMPRASWLLSTIYVMTLFLTCINRLLLPLRFEERVLPEQNMFIPGLENTQETPDYEITYIANGIGFVTIVPYLVGFYSLYIGLTGCITAHYNKLYTEFESLLQYATVDESQNIDYEKFKKQLIKLTEQHCKLIGFARDVRVLFNSTLGFDFGMITISFGVLLIQISRLGVTLFLDFLAYFLVTLIVYCMPGENMRAVVDLLPASIWSSGWEVFKPNDRKSVLMVLLLAQKRQIMTAGTFVPVTYQTLMKILKTCFSIYAAFDAAKGAGSDVIVE